MLYLEDCSVGSLSEFLELHGAGSAPTVRGTARGKEIPEYNCQKLLS